MIFFLIFPHAFWQLDSLALGQVLLLLLLLFLLCVFLFLNFLSCVFCVAFGHSPWPLIVPGSKRSEQTLAFSQALNRNALMAATRMLQYLGWVLTYLFACQHACTHTAYA